MCEHSVGGGALWLPYGIFEGMSGRDLAVGLLADVGWEQGLYR